MALRGQGGALAAPSVNRGDAATFKKLIYMKDPMKDPLKRDFYAEMCRVERWSTRTFEKKVARRRRPLRFARQDVAVGLTVVLAHANRADLTAELATWLG